MPLANLPPLIVAFLTATEQRDVVALLATFSENAILTDRGREYHGAAVREWSERLCLSEGASVHPINVMRRAGKTVLTVLFREGGSVISRSNPVQLDWWYTISGGRISVLTIVQEKAPDLPPPVAAYIQATNAFDLDPLLDTFAEDALVNDQLSDYWGKSAIKKWAARDLIEKIVTMYVASTREHYGNYIVTVNIDGEYDKRGLPDPLVLSFHFSLREGKIVQLFVLRNEPDV